MKNEQEFGLTSELDTGELKGILNKNLDYLNIIIIVLYIYLWIFVHNGIPLYDSHQIAVLRW